MRRMWAAGVGLMVALSSSGCSLISALYTAADPRASPPPGATVPIEPLGPVVQAGRVEMPGSGFAVTIPEGWTVEVVSPDPDCTAAAPGDAWEALRAYAPDRSAACSISVGVAAEGQPPLDQRFGVGASESIDGPRWVVHEGTPTLQVREPTIVSAQGGSYGVSTSFERTRADYPSLAHEVLYAIVCAAAVDRDFSPLTDSLELLPSSEPRGVASCVNQMLRLIDDGARGGSSGGWAPSLCAP